MLYRTEVEGESASKKITAKRASGSNLLLSSKLGGSFKSKVPALQNGPSEDDGNELGGNYDGSVMLSH